MALTAKAPVEYGQFDGRDAQDLQRRMSWGTALLLRLFARRLNRDLFAPVLCRAKERGVINNRQFYELHHQFDPTQRGVVGRIYRD